MFMFTEICAEIKNYFSDDKDRHLGDFCIINGDITPSFEIPTDYIRVVGSCKNDGVHKRDSMGNFGLIDEGVFHGSVWIMKPPPDFIALVEEIQSWQEMNGKFDSTAMSPYQSESFGGYSYTKSSTSGGTSWKKSYASRLNIYRKIRSI